MGTTNRVRRIFRTPVGFSFCIHAHGPQCFISIFCMSHYCLLFLKVYYVPYVVQVHEIIFFTASNISTYKIHINPVAFSQNDPSRPALDLFCTNPMWVMICVRRTDPRLYLLLVCKTDPSGPPEVTRISLCYSQVPQRGPLSGGAHQLI